MANKMQRNGGNALESAALAPPLRRERVLERIASAALRPVVLLVAPAGYGKSIALGQFLATLTEPVVRYDLRAEQGDLLAFLRGFAERLAPFAPDARATLAGAFESNVHSASRGRDLAIWMHAHLRDYRGTIAIDDLHACDADTEVARFCSTLVGLTKGPIRWILVSRTAFELPVGTWLAYGDADLPIDETDLRFTAHELRAAAVACGSDIGDDEITAMMSLTDGWPTALGFALRSSARSGDLEVIAAMTREMAYSYFADQIYRTLNYEERALVESGALLDEIDADVLVAAGFDRARSMLEDLRRRVAFIFEERPGVYRCHDLFRTFALHRVDRSGAAATFERRANLADGLERCGCFAEALRMNVAGGRNDRVLELLERHGFDLLAKGLGDTVVEAIGALDESTRRMRPLVVALRGIVAEGSGNYEEADRLLEGALAHEMPQNVRAGIVLRLARLRVNNGADVGRYLRELADSEASDVERCDAIAILAATAARSDDRPAARDFLRRSAQHVARIDDDDARARILQRNGIAHLEIGDVNEAARALDAAENIASERGLWSIATRANLGLSHIALFVNGNTAAALDHAERAATAAARAGELRGIEKATASVMSIQLIRGCGIRLSDFELKFSQVASRDSASKFYVAWGRAQIAAWEGRFGDAHRLIGGIVSAQPVDADRAVGYGSYALYLALDSEFERSSEAVAAARALFERPTEEVFGAIFFDFARVFSGLAEAISGRHTSSQRILRRHRSKAESRAQSAYEAVVLLARAQSSGASIGLSFYEALGDLKSAGFGGYSNCLSAVKDHLDRIVSNQPRIRLTETEQRVLGLLAAGLAPKEVATELGRSVLTVQTHVQNVITKFECHGRAEAIALAQRQRLI